MAIDLHQACTLSQRCSARALHVYVGHLHQSVANYVTSRRCAAVRDHFKDKDEPFERDPAARPVRRPTIDLPYRAPQLPAERISPESNGQVEFRPQLADRWVFALSEEDMQAGLMQPSKPAIDREDREHFAQVNSELSGAMPASKVCCHDETCI